MLGIEKKMFEVDPEDWTKTEDITMGSLVGLAIYFWSGFVTGPNVLLGTIAALVSLTVAVGLVGFRRIGVINPGQGELILKSGAVALALAIVGGLAIGVANMILG